VKGLVKAVQSGHLRMTSDDLALGPALRKAGVDGALPRGDRPLAYPVVYNETGGKLDHWLERTITYTAGGCRGPRRRSTITMTLRIVAPRNGLPPYLTIYIDESGRHVSYDAGVVLSVYGTSGARLVSATLDLRPLGSVPERPGDPFLSNASEGGHPVWYLLLKLPRTVARQLVLQLDEPTSIGSPRVPEQPLARPMTATTSVPACKL
jgi:hypothetical protein